MINTAYIAAFYVLAFGAADRMGVGIGYLIGSFVVLLAGTLSLRQWKWKKDNRTPAEYRADVAP